MIEGVDGGLMKFLLYINNVTDKIRHKKGRLKTELHVNDNVNKKQNIYKSTF